MALSDLTRTVGASVRCVAMGGNDAAAESGDAPAIIELWDVGGDCSRAQLRKTFYERVAGVVYVWDAKVRGAPQRLTIGLRHQACTCVVLTRAHTIGHRWGLACPRTRGALREWASDIARHASFDRGGAVPPASTPNNGSDMHEHAYASEPSRCWRATWAVAGARNDAADADLLAASVHAQQPTTGARVGAL